MDTISRDYMRALDISRDQDLRSLLQDMVEKHLARYIFTNLDILLNPAALLSLDIGVLYRKIVTARRGGYCFEQNKLLYHVLRDMGLEVAPRLARVLYGAESEAEIARTHRTTLVTLDGAQYVMDVGFGGNSPLCLVPMSGDVVTCPRGYPYRLRPTAAGEHQLETARGDEFFPLYLFDDATCHEVDFEVASFYTSRHPDSKFTRELILSKVSRTETSLIHKNLFSRKTAGGREDTLIAGPAHLQELLGGHFALELSPAECERIYQPGE